MLWEKQNSLRNNTIFNLSFSLEFTKWIQPFDYFVISFIFKTSKNQFETNDLIIWRIFTLNFDWLIQIFNYCIKFVWLLLVNLFIIFHSSGNLGCNHLLAFQQLEMLFQPNFGGLDFKQFIIEAYFWNFWNANISEYF